MTYQRDPLSVQYDVQAADLIGKAIARYRRKQRNRAVPGFTTVYVPNPVGDLWRDDSPDRLSRHERAFQRALYHDPRIHKPRKTTGGPWSLQVRWGPVPLLGGTRKLELQLHRDTSGKHHVDTNVPRGEQWQRNVALQSGGIGSPKQRFPA